MRLAPRSLIARILLAEFGAIAGVAVLLPLLLVALLGATVARYQDRALIGQARAIGAGLEAGRDGRVSVAGVPLSAYASAYDGHAFAVTDARGTARLASRYAGLAPWRAAPRLPRLATFRVARFVGASLPVAAGAGRLWVVVTLDEGRPGALVDDVRRAFQWRYLASLLPVLLVLPLVNSLLIRRLVRSVRHVSAQASAIGPLSLHARLGRADLPAEVVPLVSATNALLGRLEESFAEQAAFIGNVVHELRTPLATLRVTLDGVADEALRARLGAQADRIGHVVAQLRDLAGLEKMGAAPEKTGAGPEKTGAGEELERFDLAALAAETVAEHVPEALATAHEVELLAPDAPVVVAANRVLAGLALANLLANALRHTPAGTRVTVTVAADGTLRVEDDGPGLAAGPDQLTRRFWRADHRRSDSAGLGLAIVERICAVHGGALAIANRPGGGASFAIGFGTA